MALILIFLANLIDESEEKSDVSNIFDYIELREYFSWALLGIFLSIVLINFTEYIINMLQAIRIKISSCQSKKQPIQRK